MAAMTPTIRNFMKVPRRSWNEPDTARVAGLFVQPAPVDSNGRKRQEYDSICPYRHDRTGCINSTEKNGCNGPAAAGRGNPGSPRRGGEGGKPAMDGQGGASRAWLSAVGACPMLACLCPEPLPHPPPLQGEG